MSLVSNLFLLFVAVSVLVYYIVPHKFQWLVLLCFSYIYPVFPIGYLGDCTCSWKGRGRWKPQKCKKFSGALINIEFWYAWSDKVYKFYDWEPQCFVSYEFKRNGNPASIGNIVLHFPILRISSGCVLEELWCGKILWNMRYSYLSFHRFCRDQSEDTGVWHISFMNLINSKVRILPEALSAFSGDFLRRWSWRTGQQCL